MKILDRLPIQDQPTSLRFGAKYITVRRDQVLVWMSVHLARMLEPETSIPKFPALLDTGNNFGFSIPERQLREWAGIDPGLMAILGDAEINGQVVACEAAGRQRSGCTRTSPAGRRWPAAGRRSG